MGFNFHRAAPPADDTPSERPTPCRTIAREVIDVIRFFQSNSQSIQISKCMLPKFLYFALFSELSEILQSQQQSSCRISALNFTQSVKIDAQRRPDCPRFRVGNSTRTNGSSRSTSAKYGIAASGSAQPDSKNTYCRLSGRVFSTIYVNSSSYRISEFLH